MKPQLLLSLALIVQHAGAVAAFQTRTTAHAAVVRSGTTAAAVLFPTDDEPPSSSISSSRDDNDVRGNKFPANNIPHHGESSTTRSSSSRRRRRLLSNLTVRPLPALASLKEDERARSNRRRLVRMGISMSAAFITSLKRTKMAMAAATPLLVTKGGHVTPLISAIPGPGMVPGVRGVTPQMFSEHFGRQVGGLPNGGAWFFALSLFVATALLRNVGDRYKQLVLHVTKSLAGLVKNDDEEEEGEIDLGLPKEVDWDAYSHAELDPLRNERGAQEDVRRGRFTLNPYTLMFEPVKKKEDTSDLEGEKLQRAGEFFRRQKYRQHHHPVHVAHTRYEEVGYLDSLPINEARRNDDNPPKGYLDTLVDAKASTWGAYKHRLEETAKPVVTTEVEELKEEVSELRTLMRDEQSMYRASNHALELVVDAQRDGLRQSATDEELKEFDARMSTREELREFDRKAREYEETVVASKKKDATTVGGDGEEKKLSS